MRDNYCANASVQAGGLSVPGCVDNAPEVRQTIYYDEHGIDTDTNCLCAECAETVKKEMENHGYRVETEAIDD